jgi:hypothetical protein
MPKFKCEIKTKTQMINLFWILTFGFELSIIILRNCHEIHKRIKNPLVIEQEGSFKPRYLINLSTANASPLKQVYPFAP